MQFYACVQARRVGSRRLVHCRRDIDLVIAGRCITLRLVQPDMTPLRHSTIIHCCPDIITVIGVQLVRFVSLCIGIVFFKLRPAIFVLYIIFCFNFYSILFGRNIFFSFYSLSAKIFSFSLLFPLSVCDIKH